MIRVHVAANGNIWVFHRCFNDKPQGEATCLNRGEANPPILEFNPAGRLLRSFGVGLFAHPHGFTVDKDGNIWTTDTNDDETILGMPAKNPQGVAMGQTVFKISPEGKVLMTIGTPGVGGSGPYTFRSADRGCDWRNGDIFVSDGHSRNKSNSARIMKYLERREVHQGVGTHGIGARGFSENPTISSSAVRRARCMWPTARTIVSGLRSGRQFHRRVEAVRSAELGLCGQNDNIYVGATYKVVAPGPDCAPADDRCERRAIVIGNAITGELKYLIPIPAI